MGRRVNIAQILHMAVGDLGNPHGVWNCSRFKDRISLPDIPGGVEGLERLGAWKLDSAIQ